MSSRCATKNQNEPKQVREVDNDGEWNEEILVVHFIRERERDRERDTHTQRERIVLTFQLQYLVQFMTTVNTNMHQGCCVLLRTVPCGLVS